MFRLNIYLIKESVKNIENVVLEKYRNEIQEIELKTDKKALFILKDPESSSPDWYEYLKPRVSANMLRKSMTSPSALLVTKNDDRYFALSFGYGRYFLDDSTAVPDFGLKVCLNTLASEEIKTVDKKTLEKIALNTRQQAAIPINFNTFDIEIDRDLIKSVDGRSDQDFGKYFKGATSLTITTNKSIEKLGDLCTDLIKLYSKKKYKTEFGWIDNITYVSDEVLVGKLNHQILKLLDNEDTKSCFLGIPEMVDDSKIKYYGFSGPRDRSEYQILPSIEQYLAVRKNANTNKTAKTGATFELSPTLDDLQKDRIEAYGWNDSPVKIDHWTIFRCLHAEVEYSSKFYKLVDGNWYEIDKNYLAGIEKRIKEIPEFSNNLINMKFKEKEGDYNSRLSESLNAACLDADLVHLEGRSPFEFCDIFTKNHEIIHVKKYSGAASISHLLYQSHVSGQAFANDLAVRDYLSEKDCVKKLNLQKKVHPDKFRTGDYKIVYVIAAKKKEKLHKLISFFCKVSMAHKYKVLKGMGYSVEYKVVQIEPT